MTPEIILLYLHNAEIRDFELITSYPNFHGKIVTLDSISGSSKVNVENTELSFTLADDTAAVLQTTRYCR